MTPVVFLHASSGNSRMWVHQEPFFTAAGYRFVAYDRKGKGAAADELELVAQQLKLQRFQYKVRFRLSATVSVLLPG